MIREIDSMGWLSLSGEGSRLCGHSLGLSPGGEKSRTVEGCENVATNSTVRHNGKSLN